MTTETNAEKLKAIMQRSVGLTDNEGCFADIVQLGVDDYAFIIQQAERAQQLESGNARLQKALEFYANRFNYVQSLDDREIGYPPEIMNDTGYEARQALAGDPGD